MAFNQTRRLSGPEMQADEDALLAIKQLPDYKPINPSYNTERLSVLEAALNQAEQEERRLANALAAARDTATAAAWELHNAVLGAKTQVIAQYGPDSNEVQSLGLKKKSERKRPVRRSTAVAS
ncbi:MAG TPA: hypothetical protein VFT66_17265 [Roseiflexaceae bacterium]|nr:hypothetical protein [Roseiflexaceae bacterium]